MTQRKNLSLLGLVGTRRSLRRASAILARRGARLDLDFARLCLAHGPAAARVLRRLDLRAGDTLRIERVLLRLRRAGERGLYAPRLGQTAGERWGLTLRWRRETNGRSGAMLGSAGYAECRYAGWGSYRTWYVLRTGGIVHRTWTGARRFVRQDEVRPRFTVTLPA